MNVDDSPTPRLERVWEDSYYHVSYINSEALCFSRNFDYTSVDAEHPGASLSEQ